MATNTEQETQLAKTGKALAVAGLVIFLFLSVLVGAIVFVVGLCLALAGGAK